MKQEYYTENKRRVTEYIESNRTLFIEDLNEAIKKGVELNTYHYEMFTIEKNELKFIGYGVPRN